MRAWINIVDIVMYLGVWLAVCKLLSWLFSTLNTIRVHMLRPII